jgi:hypothetical protein
MRYFTGTTAECLEAILREGKISTNPPHRVWKEYSQDYVYLILFDESKEEDRDEVFDFAAEQSSFAIHALNHDTRVVLEVEGLDATCIDTDPDATRFGAVRYSKDIPLSSIVAVHTENGKDDKKIKEFIAITHFIRFKQENKLPFNDFECLFDEEDFEENREQVFEEIGIAHLGLIDPFLFIDHDEMLNRYHDLYEEVEYQASFIETNIEYVHKSFSIV